MIQIFFLTVLLALLGSGGKVTLCEVFSLVGLEVHHHFPHETDRSDYHPGSFTFQSHGDHDHDHGKVPCDKECAIQLSEAPTPGLLKIPAVSESYLSPFSVRVLLAAEVPGTLFWAFDVLKPPDQVVPFTDPTFTGRFLV